jgi:histidinol-phosphatase
MTESIPALLDFAAETAWQAGLLTLGYFQTGLQPDWKSDLSPVTLADRKSEEFIRGRIEKQYPRHAIVGEEFGVAETEGATHRWIIDPIDGTRSFVRGVPLYGVLIGLEIEGKPTIGAAYFPALGEMLTAATGQGCRWNGRPARVSTTPHLRDGVISHADTGSFARYGRAEAWQRLQAAAGYRAGWTDSYGYLLVATGRVEAMFDPMMNVWDCAPFLPILQEAGGYFGDWEGNPTIYGQDAFATTTTLLPEILRLIEGSE